MKMKNTLCNWNNPLFIEIISIYSITKIILYYAIVFHDNAIEILSS